MGIGRYYRQKERAEICGRITGGVQERGMGRRRLYVDGPSKVRGMCPFPRETRKLSKDRTISIFLNAQNNHIYNTRDRQPISHATRNSPMEKQRE